MWLTRWEQNVRISARQRAVDTPHFDAFLSEAVNGDPGSDNGLGCEELFGLYTSWCLLTGRVPRPPKALWHALHERGITPGRNTLAMTGPAARDYIVSSAPSLV